METQIIIGKGTSFASVVKFLPLYRKDLLSSTEYTINLVHSVHMYSAFTFLELSLNHRLTNTLILVKNKQKEQNLTSIITQNLCRPVLTNSSF